MSTSLAELCEGYPDEFFQFLVYCRQLTFEEDPNYAHLKTLFRMLYYRLGFISDGVFDWNKSKPVSAPLVYISSAYNGVVP